MKGRHTAVSIGGESNRRARWTKTAVGATIATGLALLVWFGQSPSGAPEPGGRAERRERPVEVPPPRSVGNEVETKARQTLEKLFEERQQEFLDLMARRDIDDAAKFEWLWKRYSEHRVDPLWSRYYADSLSAITHGGNAARFARRIAAEIRSRDALEEARASLVRALADLYIQEGDPQRPYPRDENDFVLGELRDVMDSGRPLAAQAALLQYVRLGYFEDVPERLERAWRQQTIDSETYVKELLLQMPSVPPVRQERMLNGLLASGMPARELAAIIPGMAAIRPGLFDALSPPSRAALAKVLADNEPQFSPGAMYSATEGVDYVDWLVARFEAPRPVVTLRDAGAEARMFAEAAVRADDPRKIIAIVLSDRGGTAVIDELVRSGRADGVIRRLDADAAQLPQDAAVLEPLLLVRAAIQARRR